MSSKIESFIQNTSYKNRKNNKEFKIFFDVPVFVKDPLPEHVDILNVLSQVEEKIPYSEARKMSSQLIEEQNYNTIRFWWRF